MSDFSSVTKAVQKIQEQNYQLAKAIQPSFAITEAIQKQQIPTGAVLESAQLLQGVLTKSTSVFNDSFQQTLSAVSCMSTALKNSFDISSIAAATSVSISPALTSFSQAMSNLVSGNISFNLSNSVSSTLAQSVKKYSALNTSITNVLSRYHSEKSIPIIAKDEILTVESASFDMLNETKQFVSAEQYNDLKHQVENLKHQVKSCERSRRIDIAIAIISIIIPTIFSVYSIYSSAKADAKLDKYLQSIDRHLCNVEQALLSDKYSHNK